MKCTAGAKCKSFHTGMVLAPHVQLLKKHGFLLGFTFLLPLNFKRGSNYDGHMEVGIIGYSELTLLTPPSA